MVNSDSIAALYSRKEIAKTKIQQAQGTLQAISIQISACVDKMQALGVTPETAEQELSIKKQELENLYSQADSLLTEIASALSI